jgi:phytoene/squalene synthetase
MDKPNWDNMSLLSQFNFLREIIIDLLDGNSYWEEIQKQTGLDEKRCKEIENVFLLLTSN